MENKLRYSYPASCFEEALPLGNGSVGVMVYGGWDKERLSLNHDTLWSGKPRRYSRPGAIEANRLAQKMVLDGQRAEATKLIEREISAPFGQSYMPLGNLYVEFHCESDVTGYLRELDLERGIATVSYERGGVRFVREVFVSHPDGCAVIHITASAPSDLSFSIDSQLKSSFTVDGNRIILKGEAPSFASPEFAKDISPIVYDGDGIKFAAVGKAVTDGNISTDDSRLLVTGATDVTFVLCIETSYISFDTLPTGPYLEPCLARTEENAKKPYALLLSRHEEDHSSLYNRTLIDLGFPSSEKMTDERLRSTDKDSDLGMIELLYNFGRYLVIASSREGTEATNLQGIWNELVYPPWSSNYTVNINTEMNYWPVLMCNLAGLDLPIVELLKKISVTGEETAKSFYGAKGYCAHHNIDLWGLSSPVGAGMNGCCRWAYWSMASGWLCRHAWEHYEYTLDEEFLRNTAYPLMKGAAEFYLDIMIKDGEHYVICPTTSPENAYVYKGESIPLSRNAAMTQGILIDLFENLIKAADVLGIDDDTTRAARERLPYLNTYVIGSDGQLLEYDEEFPEAEIHHRHTSHLYGLYPGESITTESTPSLAEACRRTLIRRGDVSTGWSMGWRACLWAKLKDGDHSLVLMKNQLTYTTPEKNAAWIGGTYANLFDAHPPFQIDGNFGVTAAIALLLLQCEDGKIRILPALPNDFRKGSVKGLLAKGGITVDIAWEDHRLTSFSLTSPTDKTVTVATPSGEMTLSLTANERKTITG